MKTIQIGTALVAPEQKGRGFIPVSELPYGPPINVPIMIVNGAKAGPKLWVNACIHGSEFHGTFAIWKTIETLDARTLRGTFIATPAMNVSAFEAGDRTSPYDKLDMNRIFPGDPNGEYTQQLGYALFQHIIGNAEYFIDLHTGQKESLVHNWVFFHGTGGKAGEDSEKLARAFGYRVVQKTEKEKAVGFLYRELTERGIPSILPESGGGAVYVDDYAEVLHKGIMNVMKCLGMIEGRPEQLQSYQSLSEYVWPKAKRGGLFSSKVKLGEKVSSGQVIATIRNIFGDETERITSPFDGVILFIRTFPVVKIGDSIIMVGR